MATIQYDYSNFDADSAGEYNSYIPPEGEYRLYVVACFDKNNDALGGDFVELELMGETTLGEKLPNTFCVAFSINSKNDIAAKIASETLGRIYCRIKNIQRPSNDWDTADLVEGCFIATIKHNKKGDKTYIGLTKILPLVSGTSSNPQSNSSKPVINKPNWS